MTEPIGHVDEFRLIFNGGGLWTKDGWENVKQHQIMEFFEVGVLSDLLRLSDSDKQRLESVALIHDWRKRLDKNLDKRSLEQEKEAEIYLRAVNPDSDLMLATDPKFIEKFLTKNSEITFLEMLQFYIDDITEGERIVRFNDRIDELAKRRPELNSDPDLIARLHGKKYWDAEKEVGHKIENIIFNKLVENGIEIGSQEEIPDLVIQKVKEKRNV